MIIRPSCIGFLTVILNVYVCVCVCEPATANILISEVSPERSRLKFNVQQNLTGIETSENKHKVWVFTPYQDFHESYFHITHVSSNTHVKITHDSTGKFSISSAI